MTPEYFSHLAEHAPERLLAFYREFVAPEVELDDLVGASGYDPQNRWKISTEGRPAHLRQASNNLIAAVDLVAKATVLRHDPEGMLITAKQELARCAGLGEPTRNSDPQIAALVNSAARSGREVTLLDPVGLYINGIDTTGMETPDGADPRQFWSVERGTATHTLRASFAVPPEQGHALGDITLQGRPLEFGAQLADRVSVRVTIVAKRAGHALKPHPCGTHV